MLQKVHAMLDGLLKSPEKFEDHNKMYVTLIRLYFSCLLIIMTQVICFNSDEDNVWI